MRFCELRGLDNEVASSLIAKSPKVEAKKFLDNPESFSKKILVFRGNYDGFDTNRLCVRTFEYISKEKKWKVSDVIIYDLFTSSFDYHFSKRELEEKFEAFVKAKGFAMDT